MVVVVMEEMEDGREVWEIWRELREWYAKFGLWEMKHEVVIEGYYSVWLEMSALLLTPLYSSLYG